MRGAIERLLGVGAHVDVPGVADHANDFEVALALPIRPCSNILPTAFCGLPK